MPFNGRLIFPFYLRNKAEKILQQDVVFSFRSSCCSKNLTLTGTVYCRYKNSHKLQRQIIFSLMYLRRGLLKSPSKLCGGTPRLFVKFCNNHNKSNFVFSTFCYSRQRDKIYFVNPLHYQTKYTIFAIGLFAIHSIGAISANSMLKIP